jgi:hypothetical protein
VTNLVLVGQLVAVSLAANQRSGVAGGQPTSDERDVGLVRPRGVPEGRVVALVPVLSQRLVVTYVRGHRVEYGRALGRQKRPKRFAWLTVVRDSCANEPGNGVTARHP